jgi:hypothetical protein
MPAYSNFGNTTGKHGPSISRSRRQSLKAARARAKRHRHHKTTQPKYSPAHRGPGVRNHHSSKSWR